MFTVVNFHLVFFPPDSSFDLSSASCDSVLCCGCDCGGGHLILDPSFLVVVITATPFLPLILMSLSTPRHPKCCVRPLVPTPTLPHAAILDTLPPTIQPTPHFSPQWGPFSLPFAMVGCHRSVYGRQKWQMQQQQ